VTDRYFSPDEVEALIPTLTDIVERLQGAHAEIQECRGRLQAEHQRLEMSGGGVLDRQQWRADREALDAALPRAKAALDEIHALGGVAKVVEEGLVDFPHLRDGRVVNLCWKFGETRIRWWHGMDEGYSARKAL
jgi:hypothetical protein